MPENHASADYARKVTPVERFFNRSPFSLVTVVARIRGSVSESDLGSAARKVQQRHPILMARIAEDDPGDPWFTTEGADHIPVETVPRESDDHWIEVIHESSRIPFDFAARPAIRFILVQSPTTSDLIVLCHHIICDGLSLAYLVRDLMLHLGDPTREVEVLPDPIPIELDSVPKDVSVNAVVKYFVNRMNRKWQPDRILFDQEDYRSLTEAYWANYKHQVISVELSEAQTSTLVDRCRSKGVTVNSALSAAFVGAQYAVQGDKPYHANIAVAASLRDRLLAPVGEVMGFYVGLVTPKYKYKLDRGFWDNARVFHQKVRPLYTNKNLFQDPLTWCYLDPTILEAINFKKLARIVPEQSPRYQKLSVFGSRDDVVSSILKRDKMDSLDRITMGTAVTNLTRLDFPRKYGALELDRLIMNPGGAFPLANVNLVLGAVTCAGKLSLLIEYVDTNVDTSTMEQIRDRALEFLLEE